SVAHADDTSTAPSTTVEKCGHKLGTIAVHEPQSDVLARLSGYGLSSPIPLLRIMIQESGCFDVVERGVAMQNIQQERQFGAQDELQSGSNMGKGQMQAADFVMTANAQFAQNTGGVNGSVLGLLGHGLGRLGALSGGLKFKEAHTSLLISDVRSSLQVAAAEGSAKATDFSLSGWGVGGGAFGSLGGYTNTPEGKVIAAGLLDNYNHIVIDIRDKPQLIQSTSESSKANAANSVQAGAPIRAGDVYRAKINKVRVYKNADSTSKVVATLSKQDELIPSGEETNGYVKVDSSEFYGGWVQKTLISRSS